MATKIKKNDDRLPQAHNHRHRDFLDRVGHYEWFQCSCGNIKKVYVD